MESTFIMIIYLLKYEFFLVLQQIHFKINIVTQNYKNNQSLQDILYETNKMNNTYLLLTCYPVTRKS